MLILSKSEHTQLEELFGPETTFSDHKKGDIIRFRENAQTKQGTILRARALGPTIQGGWNHFIVYVVDANGGFPSMVYLGDVVEG